MHVYAFIYALPQLSDCSVNIFIVPFLLFPSLAHTTFYAKIKIKENCVCAFAFFSHPSSVSQFLWNFSRCCSQNKKNSSWAHGVEEEANESKQIKLKKKHRVDVIEYGDKFPTPLSCCLSRLLLGQWFNQLRRVEGESDGRAVRKHICIVISSGCEKTLVSRFEACVTWIKYWRRLLGENEMKLMIFRKKIVICDSKWMTNFEF